MDHSGDRARHSDSGMRRSLLALAVLAFALLLGLGLICRFEQQLQLLLPQTQYELVGRLSLWTMALLLGLMCAVFGIVLLLWDRSRRTDRRRLQAERDQLSLAQESMRMAFRMIGGCMFEYDLETHRFLQLENAAQLLGEDEQAIREAWSDRGRVRSRRDGAEWADVVISCYHPDDWAQVKEGYRLLEEEGQVVLQARMMRPDGPVWCQSHMALVYGADGRAQRVIGNVLDISDTHSQLEQLRTAAQQDPLTGLCNRTTFQCCVQQVLDDRREQTHAFLLLDVDDFKGINDSRGHVFGDQILQQAAQRIRELFRSSDVVGRLGGDEFVVFMRNAHDREGTLKKVQALCTLHCGGQGQRPCPEGELALSISVGVAFSRPGMDYDALYQQADVALYRAKDLGKSGFSVYEPAEGPQTPDIDGPAPL